MHQERSIGNFKFFKWWYAKDIPTYKELLEKETAELTAMTAEEEIVHKTVSLTKDENNLVMVELGSDTYCLTPNQHITETRAEQLKDFWLVQNKCCWKTAAIMGINDAIENSKAVMLPEGVELFGVPTEKHTSIKSASIKAIIPIGEGKYIAWEDQSRCYIIGSRETDDIVIKNFMQRTARM